MNRNEMIKWLQETTVPEQWGDNCQLPKECYWQFTDSRLHDCNYRSVLRTIFPSSESDIFFENIFPQPTFIDDAEYWLYDSSSQGEPTKVRYVVSTNAFYEVGKPFGLKAPASDFGKNFTVELVPVDTETLIDELKSGDRTINDVRRILKAVRQPPHAPGVPPQTNVNALGQYLKVNSYDTQEIAGAALSRIKEQDVIVGRVGKLNEVCQKHGIGSMGDSVIDSVIDYIGKQESLYERVVKALGERKVPIGGVDHLVGQVKTDHMKAKLLDKIIKEFNIPEGGDIINWLRNRTESPAPAAPAAQPRNKYDREILPGVYVDVYDVLGAFKTNSTAIDHAVKKLLAPGQRGVKDRITDLNEAIESIQREIDRVSQWGDK